MRGGGPLSNGAVWTADGGALLAPAGAAVRVYAPDCGDAPVAVLRGHAADVTGVARHPVDDGKIYTASLDGTLKTWDLASGACVATVSVGAPVTGLAVPPRSGTAWLSTAWERGAGRIFRVKLATGAVEGERFKLAAPGALTLSTGGGVVAAHEKRTLWLWRADGELHAPVVVTHTKALTSVAVDADDDRVAAGDVTGRITLWRGLAAALARGGGGGGPASSGASGTSGAPPPPLPPPRTLHWHSAAVLALDFTADGEFLLSGGHEGVLTAWHLSTSHRAFLPRLGGAVARVAAAPPRAARAGTAATAHADNVLRVVSLATASVEWSVRGLSPRPRGARGVAALVNGSLLALAARGGRLQLWDVAADRHAGSLAVAPRTDVNALPAGTATARAAAPPPPGGPRVTALAVADDAATAVTVDTRPSPGAPGGRASSLKMWAAPAVRAAGGAPFVLAAEVVDAHSGIITGMAATPDGATVATAGADGDVKLWERRHDGAAHRWRCGWAARLRGAPFAAVDVSTDGTLVVAAAGADVGAWRAADGDRVAVVPPPPAARGGPAVAVALVPASPIVVIAYGGGAPCVAGWDLVAGRHAWCAPRARATRLAAAPAPARAVAIALAPPDGAAPDAAPAGGRVVVLDAATGAATAGWDLPRCGADALVWLPPATHGGALAEAAAAASGTTPPLLIVTGDREYCVAPSAAAAAAAGEEPCPALAPRGAKAGPTPLAAAVGVGAAAAPATPDNAAVVAKRAGRAPAWGALFDAPSHALPPPAALAPRFLEALLLGEE